MSENNPFAALAAQQDAAQVLEAQNEPAAVVAPSPEVNPFGALNQPPPFAPSPAVHPSLLDPAAAKVSLPSTAHEVPEPVTLPEEKEAEQPAAPSTADREDAPVPSEANAEESKPKRRPGRPRKPKPESDETPAPSSDLSASAVAMSLPADKAWMELTKRVTAGKSEQEAASAQVVSLQDRASDNRANIVRVEHEIAELTATLERLQDQQESIEDSAEAAAEALTAAERRVTETNIALTKVSAYILSLTDSNPGLVGDVRVTVLDDKTYIEPA